MTAVANESTPSLVETLTAKLDAMPEEAAFAVLLAAAMSGVEGIPGPDDEGINGDIKVALKVAIPLDPEAFVDAFEFAESLAL